MSDDAPRQVITLAELEEIRQRISKMFCLAPHTTTGLTDAKHPIHCSRRKGHRGRHYGFCIDDTVRAWHDGGSLQWTRRRPKDLVK